MLQDTHHDLRTPTALNLREAHFESILSQNKGGNRRWAHVYEQGNGANRGEKAAAMPFAEGGVQIPCDNRQVQPLILNLLILCKSHTEAYP